MRNAPPGWTRLMRRTTRAASSGMDLEYSSLRFMPVTGTP